MAACSAACSAPGTRARSTPTASRAASSRSYQTPRVCRVCRGRSSGTVSSTVPSGARRWYSTTCVVTVTSPNATRTGPCSRQASTADTSTSAVERASVRQSGVGGAHERDPGVEIEVLARGSSRRGAGTPRRRARWRAPSRRRPCRASARCPPRPRPPVRARSRGCPRCPPGRSRVEGQNQPAGRRRSTPSATSSSSTALGAGPAEHPGDVGLGQRQLGRGAGQLRARARRGCRGRARSPPRARRAAASGWCTR